MLYQFEHFFADDDEKHIQNPKETESRADDNKNTGRNFDEMESCSCFFKQRGTPFPIRHDNKILIKNVAKF